MQINSQRKNCPSVLVNNDWPSFGKLVWLLLLMLLLAAPPQTGSSPLSLCSLMCRIKQEVKKTPTVISGSNILQSGFGRKYLFIQRGPNEKDVSYN